MTSAPLAPVRVPLRGPIASQVHALYRRAFPPEERVPLPLLHASAVRRRAISFTAWVDPELSDPSAHDAEVVAFTYSFVSKDLVYLAFLAVDDRLRSAGYGRRILEWFADEHPDLPLFLEIEPIDESAGNYGQRLRRLAFYQRNGFTVSNMLTHEAGQTFRVLHRGPGAGAISAERLERELNAFGAGLVRTRVTTD